MNVIDNDLLSIQEARIILESAIIANDNLKTFPKDCRDAFIDQVIDYFKHNLLSLIEEAYQETNYGNVEDEFKLGKYFLENILDEFKRFPQIMEIVEYPQRLTKMVAISKGIIVCKLNAYLPVVNFMHYLLLAIHTNNPLIIIPHKRCYQTIIKMWREVLKISQDYYYPLHSLSLLNHISEQGEYEILKNDQVALVVENLLFEQSTKLQGCVADWFQATLGNNVVFIEKTADLASAAKEIVISKSFNHGLLPGVEQSVIVETVVSDQFKNALVNEGAYFLNEYEQNILEKILYDDLLNPKIELIGKSAIDIADIAGIKVPGNTKILVVTKPYVSKNSPYSKEKFGPILSFYTEDDWQQACEKCIELILNDNDGQSLAIYTNDAYVIEQFIEKKPVARVLVNCSTGFGSIGLFAHFPLSLSLSCKEVGGVAFKSLVPNHFMTFKEIGISNHNNIDILKQYCQNKFFNQDFLSKK